MRKLILFGIALILLINFSYGQTSIYDLRGKIADHDTNFAISNAKITIYQGDIQSFVNSYYTKKDGSFEILGFTDVQATGSVDIKIEIPNYYEEKFSYTLPSNSRIVDLGTIYLTPLTSQKKPSDSFLPPSNHVYLASLMEDKKFDYIQIREQYIHKDFTPEFESSFIVFIEDRNGVKYYKVRPSGLTSKSIIVKPFSKIEFWKDGRKTEEIELTEKPGRETTKRGCTTYIYRDIETYLKTRDENAVNIQVCPLIGAPAQIASSSSLQPLSRDQVKTADFASIDGKAVPTDLTKLGCKDSLSIIPGVNAPEGFEISGDDFCIGKNGAFKNRECNNEDNCVLSLAHLFDEDSGEIDPVIFKNVDLGFDVDAIIHGDDRDAVDGEINIEDETAAVNEDKQNQIKLIMQAANDAIKMRDRLISDVEAEFGITPMFVFGWLDENREEKIILSIITANDIGKKFGLSPGFITAAAFQEGLNTYVVSYYINPAIKPGFEILGLDYFHAEINDLKRDGFLRDDFSEYSSEGKVLFNDLQYALEAFVAVLAQRRAHFLEDAGKLGYDINSISERQLDYWTYVYYNCGRSCAQNRIKNGLEISDETGRAPAPGQASTDPHWNAKRTLSTIELISRADLFGDSELTFNEEEIKKLLYPDVDTSHIKTNDVICVSYGDGLTGFITKEKGCEITLGYSDAYAAKYGQVNVNNEIKSLEKFIKEKIRPLQLREVNIYLSTSEEITKIVGIASALYIPDGNMVIYNPHSNPDFGLENSPESKLYHELVHAYTQQLRNDKPEETFQEKNEKRSAAKSRSLEFIKKMREPDYKTVLTRPAIVSYFGRTTFSEDEKLMDLIGLINSINNPLLSSIPEIKSAYDEMPEWHHIAFRELFKIDDPKVNGFYEVFDFCSQYVIFDPDTKLLIWPLENDQIILSPRYGAYTAHQCMNIDEFLAVQMQYIKFRPDLVYRSLQGEFGHAEFYKKNLDLLLQHEWITQEDYNNVINYGNTGSLEEIDFNFEELQQLFISSFQIASEDDVSLDNVKNNYARQIITFAFRNCLNCDTLPKFKDFAIKALNDYISNGGDLLGYSRIELVETINAYDISLKQCVNLVTLEDKGDITFCDYNNALCLVDHCVPYNQISGESMLNLLAETKGLSEKEFVVYALGQIRFKPAVDEIGRLLIDSRTMTSSSDFEISSIQRASIDALKLIGSKEAIPYLKEYSKLSGIPENLADKAKTALFYSDPELKKTAYAKALRDPSLSPDEVFDIISSDSLFASILNNDRLKDIKGIGRNSITLIVFEKIYDQYGYVYPEIVERSSTQNIINSYLDEVLRNRATFNEEIIFGPDTSVIVLTHQPQRGQNFDPTLHQDYLNNRVRSVIAFQGPSDKGNFERAIKNAPFGPLVIWISAHGYKDGFCLGTDSILMSIVSSQFNFFHDSCRGYDSNKLVDLLKQRGNFNDVTIILESCFASDFAENLYEKFKKYPNGGIPTIFAASGRNKFSYGNSILYGLKTLDIPESEFITGSRILEIENNDLYFLNSDISIFFSSDDLDYNRIAQNSINHDCSACEGDNCPVDSGLASNEQSNQITTSAILSITGKTVYSETAHKEKAATIIEYMKENKIPLTFTGVNHMLDLFRNHEASQGKWDIDKLQKGVYSLLRWDVQNVQKAVSDSLLNGRAGIFIKENGNNFDVDIGKIYAVNENKRLERTAYTYRFIPKEKAKSGRNELTIFGNNQEIGSMILVSDFWDYYENVDGNPNLAYAISTWNKDDYGFPLIELPFSDETVPSTNDLPKESSYSLIYGVDYSDYKNIEKLWPNSQDRRYFAVLMEMKRQGHEEKLKGLVYGNWDKFTDWMKRRYQEYRSFDF